MNQSPPDPPIDAQLRDVPIPDGLLERLRDCIVPSDQQLDQQLREVRVPADLSVSLRQVVADGALDEWLVDVPVPPSLLVRLRMIPQPPARTRLRWMSYAAALFLMISSGYLAVLASLLASIAPHPPQPLDLPVAAQGPLGIELPAVAVQQYALQEVDPWLPSESVSPPLVAAPDIQLISNADRSNEPRMGVARSLLQEVERGLRLDQDTLLLRWGIIGYPHPVDDRLPELDIAPAPVPRGMAVPLAAGFDRAFLFNQATNPMVYLAGADPSLVQVTAPLTTRTDSYDSTLHRAERGQPPTPADIRVEDFLAAVEYGLKPPAPGHLTVYRAAGASPFGPRGCSLLQVAIKAGAAPARGADANHLTIAVDVSASMRWENRLSNCQRAIRQLVDQLGPRDRISLIAFNEQIVSQVENATRTDTRALIEEVEGLRGVGGTNLSAGLQQAIVHSLGTPLDPGYHRRVVLITDSRESNPPEVVQRLRAFVRDASSRGVNVDVLDLGAATSMDDGFLAGLARDGNGRFIPIRTVDGLRWALVEALIEQSAVVASDAVLQVTFNPRAVRWYRLLGHESTQLGGMMPAATPATLRAGQESSVLFELMLLPGEEDQVGRLHLTWTDPRSGKVKSVNESISRLQFAPSFDEAALSLQAAAVAAETAEVLRGSPFVDPRSSDLAGVQRLLDQVNPRLLERPEFQRFIALIQRLEQLPLRSSNIH